MAEQGSRRISGGASELAELPADRLLTDFDLARIFAVCTRSIRRRVRMGQLPPPVKLGQRAYWIAGHLRDFLRAKAEELCPVR